MNLKRGALSEREAENVPVCCFVNSNDELMRKWRPLNIPASHKWGVVYWAVVPPPYRKDTVLLAHDTLLAGHLGVDKTYRKVLCHFYWLEVHSDVKKFCRMCRPCQLAGKPNQHPSMSPLIPIPVMEKPFSHRLCGAITQDTGWQSIPAYHNVWLNPLSRSHFSA